MEATGSGIQKELQIGLNCGYLDKIFRKQGVEPKTKEGSHRAGRGNKSSLFFSIKQILDQLLERSVVRTMG